MSNSGDASRPLTVPLWDPQGRVPGPVLAHGWEDRNTPAYRAPKAVERPRYREPLVVRPARVTGGFVGGLLWMSLSGAQAVSLGGYGWATIAAALLAWAVAVVLARWGDRGMAVGIASAAAVGFAVAAVMILIRWTGGDWPLW